MSFLHRHKLLFGVIIFISIFAYAGFNLWVYRYAKSSKGSSPTTLWQTVTKAGAGFPGATEQDPVTSSSVIPADAGIQRTTPSASPTPTPRPTGPGEYACDPYGVCNRYSEKARTQYCTQTYADSRCLDQCGNKEKQCAK